MNEIELSEKEYFNHEGGDTMHVFFLQDVYRVRVTYNYHNGYAIIC